MPTPLTLATSSCESDKHLMVREGDFWVCSLVACPRAVPFGHERICTECGDDLAAEGYLWCTECMETMEPLATEEEAAMLREKLANLQLLEVALTNRLQLVEEVDSGTARLERRHG